MTPDIHSRIVHLRITVLLVIGASLFAHQSADAAIASLDDIQFWVGEGAHRAGLVVDWDGQSTADASLAWGFRWNDEASGETMLRAVIAADPRFYAKLGDPEGFPFGLVVFGLGYDADSDGMFAITDEDAQFDDDGVAVATPKFPAPTSVSPTDMYKEGWTAQRAWTYATSSGNPWQGGAWQWSGAGASTRVLVDGAWDSWAFNLAATTQPNTFAANPQPAVLLAAADFDANGVVDGADLLAWQRGNGLSAGAKRQDGDATGDGAVTAADLAAWADQFSGNATLAAISEPTSFSICASAIVVCVLQIFRLNPPRTRSVS